MLVGRNVLVNPKGVNLEECGIHLIVVVGKETTTIIKEMMDVAGTTKLREIAHGLNLRGIKTNQGCLFTPTTVHRILKAN